MDPPFSSSGYGQNSSSTSSRTLLPTALSTMQQSLGGGEMGGGQGQGSLSTEGLLPPHAAQRGQSGPKPGGQYQTGSDLLAMLGKGRGGSSSSGSNVSTPDFGAMGGGGGQMGGAPPAHRGRGLDNSLQHSGQPQQQQGGNLSFDMSDFPALGGAGGLLGGSGGGGGSSGGGGVGSEAPPSSSSAYSSGSYRSAHAHESAFSIQNEDFPALPGSGPVGVSSGSNGVVMANGVSSGGGAGGGVNSGAGGQLHHSLGSGGGAVSSGFGVNSSDGGGGGGGDPIVGYRDSRIQNSGVGSVKPSPQQQQPPPQQQQQQPQHQGVLKGDLGMQLQLQQQQQLSAAGGGGGGMMASPSLSSSSVGSSRADGLIPSSPGMSGTNSSAPLTSAQRLTATTGSSSSSSPMINGGSSGTPAGGAGPVDDKAKKYGLLGLLGVIRMTEPDLNVLALGSDLTTLGLNLDSQDSLYSTFASPWAEGPVAREPQYQLPMCYYLQPPALKTAHFSKFQLETLFYIFYAMPQDLLQAYAAQELYHREWRYHGDLKLWFKRAAPTDSVAPGVQFIYFDSSTWERRAFGGGLQMNVAAGLLSEEEVRVKFSPAG